MKDMKIWVIFVMENSIKFNEITLIQWFLEGKLVG